MRVVAGLLGGRSFMSPHSRRTHPMSDKVRGALFNALGDIDGLSVLDAFAGSGALGFEAVSRGATSALLLENDAPAQRAITENITMLHLQDSVKLVKANCSSWSDHNPEARFDIVLLDPPFDHLQPLALTKMAQHVQNGGLYVLHYPSGSLPTVAQDLVEVAHKYYGDSQLLFFRADRPLAGDLLVAQD